MIAGVDHIALSAKGLDEAAAALAAAGFEKRFAETGLPSDPSKRIMLSHYEPLHDIGVFQASGGGVALEVTCHGDHDVAAVGPWAVLMGGRLPDGALTPRAPSPLAGFPPGTQAFHLGSLFAPVGWLPEQDPQRDPFVEAIVLRTPDADVETAFFRGLGFRALAGEAQGKVLHLASPMPTLACRLMICEDREMGPAEAPLDARGFTCLAVYSTSIERDLASLEAAGLRDTTPVFQAQVHGRRLKVALGRTPTGAPLELLQVVRA